MYLFMNRYTDITPALYGGRRRALLRGAWAAALTPPGDGQNPPVPDSLLSQVQAGVWVGGCSKWGSWRTPEPMLRKHLEGSGLGCPDIWPGTSFLLTISLLYQLSFSPSPTAFLIYHLQLESLTHGRLLRRKGCQQGGCSKQQAPAWARGHSSLMLGKNLPPKSIVQFYPTKPSLP